MKYLWLIIIVLGALFLDGIILPALFGQVETFLTISMLISMIIVFGLQRWVFWAGLLSAFVAESVFGLFLGTLMMPWLLAAWAWYGITAVFSLKPFSESENWSVFAQSFVGLILFAVFVIASVELEKVFYNQQASFNVLKLIIVEPSVWISLIVGLTGFEFLFKSIKRPEVSRYF